MKIFGFYASHYIFPINISLGEIHDYAENILLLALPVSCPLGVNDL